MKTTTPKHIHAVSLDGLCDEKGVSAMSIACLIHNWAGERVFTTCVLNSKDFDRHRAGKHLIFIASLWSGTSQLAFRKICDILEQCDHALPPLLVLDQDCDSYQVIKNMHIVDGHGVLLLFITAVFVGHYSGSDIPQLERGLRAFLTEPKESTLK